MKKKNSPVVLALEQAQEFLDQHADVLQSVNSTDTRKALDDVLTQLTAKSADQNAKARQSKGARAKQLSARALLLEHHMRAIVKVAKASLPTLPQLASLAATASGRVPTKALIEGAKGMAQVAVEHRDVFAAALGADFLDQLVSATNDLESAVKQGESSRAQRTAATQVITAQVSRGRQVLQVLDPIVKRALGGNAGLVQDWENRRKISGPSRTTVQTSLQGATAPQTAQAHTPAVSSTPVAASTHSPTPAGGPAPAP